jgi:hypothetical protein
MATRRAVWLVGLGSRRHGRGSGTLSAPHCTSPVGSGLNYSPGRRVAVSAGGEHGGAPEQEGLDNGRMLIASRRRGDDGGSGQTEVKKRKMISSIPCAAAWFLQGAGQWDEDVDAKLPDTATGPGGQLCHMCGWHRAPKFGGAHNFYISLLRIYC